MEFLVQFDQLEGGAAAPSFRLGAADIGVVQMPFEPAGRLGRAPFRRLDPNLASARAPHIMPPSRSIRLRHMPSRLPRSATPRQLGRASSREQVCTYV